MSELAQYSPEKSNWSSITICITAYNEEEIIADTINDCITVLNTIPGKHEILVVNDGSIDRTGEILNELSKKHQTIRVLTHPRNLGIARAHSWLIKEAAGDLIFHFPADGEIKAYELYKLINKLNEGNDIVIGVRGKKDYSFYRIAISWIYNWMVQLLFKINLVDIGGIRLARATVWKNITAKSNSAFFIAERLLLAHFNGARIGFTTVDHVWRPKGRSKFNNPLKAINAFNESFKFWLKHRNRPRVDLYEKNPNPKLTSNNSSSVNSFSIVTKRKGEEQ